MGTPQRNNNHGLSSCKCNLVGSSCPLQPVWFMLCACRYLQGCSKRPRPSCMQGNPVTFSRFAAMGIAVRPLIEWRVLISGRIDIEDLDHRHRHQKLALLSFFSSPSCTLLAVSLAGNDPINNGTAELEPKNSKNLHHGTLQSSSNVQLSFPTLAAHFSFGILDGFESWSESIPMKAVVIFLFSMMVDFSNGKIKRREKHSRRVGGKAGIGHPPKSKKERKSISWI